MESLRLSTSDLCHHVVQFGIDVFPPVEIPNERTRLHIFHETARDRWPEIYERLTESDTEFKISKNFRRHTGIEGPAAPVDTFVLVANRGPVFIYPLMLPPPVGETSLQEDHLRRFQSARELFFAALPDRKIFRLGLVRDLVFATGATPCLDLLGASRSFAHADLAGGNSLLLYRDSKYNVRIRLSPTAIMKTTQLPVGQRIDEHQGYGLQVQLDVNNTDIRPLVDSDIEEVLERATGLWPDALLQYLNERSQ